MILVSSKESEEVGEDYRNSSEPENHKPGKIRLVKGIDPGLNIK